jgi:hypothetical protein
VSKEGNPDSDIPAHVRALRSEAHGASQPGKPNPTKLPERGEPGKLQVGSSEHQGEQEIKSILPSYLVDRHWDSDMAEDILAGLLPNERYREWLKANGWDNFAEYVLDRSGILPKPEDPSVPTDDIGARFHSQRTSMEVNAMDWEDSTEANLQDAGLLHLLPQFQKDMQDYRKAVKAAVDLWRKSGLL